MTGEVSFICGRCSFNGAPRLQVTASIIVDNVCILMWQTIHSGSQLHVGTCTCSQLMPTIPVSFVSVPCGVGKLGVHSTEDHAI